MDLAGFGIQQFVDIGFGLIVIGICIKTLFTDRDRLSKERSRWKEELAELQHSLQSLIAEAADASQVFDKRIQRRTSELDSLIRRAERTVAEAKTVAKSVANNRTKTVSEHFTEEEGDDLDDQNATSIIENFDPPWAQMVDDTPDSFSSLSPERNKYSSKASKAPVSNDRANVVKETAKAKVDVRTPALTPLQKQIEMQSEQDVIDEKIFRQTSIVDPVAFRIAKRLLLEGKELHVVARKLELPVSEVRHLEMLLRQEAQKVNQPLPAAMAEREIAKVRGVVRDPIERKNEARARAVTVRASAESARKPLILEMEKDEEIDNDTTLF
jgi:hypothetical protein